MSIQFNSEKKLFDALRYIDNNDPELTRSKFGISYIAALDVLGYCNSGFNIVLTEFGRNELERLYYKDLE